MILLDSVRNLLFSSPYLSRSILSFSLSHARTHFSFLLIDDRWTDQRLCRFCGCGYELCAWMYYVLRCRHFNNSNRNLFIFLYRKKREFVVQCLFFFLLLCFLSVSFLTTHHIIQKPHDNYKRHVTLEIYMKIATDEKFFSDISSFVSFICSSDAPFDNWNIKSVFCCSFVFTVITPRNYFGFGISRGNNIQHSTNKSFHNAKQIRNRW